MKLWFNKLSGFFFTICSLCQFNYFFLFKMPFNVRNQWRKKLNAHKHKTQNTKHKPVTCGKPQPRNRFMNCVPKSIVVNQSVTWIMSSFTQANTLKISPALNVFVNYKMDAMRNLFVHFCMLYFSEEYNKNMKKNTQNNKFSHIFNKL